ncbi:uncharacterized protein LOC143852837 [Tasmannia lanceolata]|uniref:uncharacterized protein LOC143852837 n=1 Tax=Tasmannia lanceolata TaxID=3420 RepID=UPI0040644D69
MERFGGSGLDGVSAVRKKRSDVLRRPRPDSQPFFEGREPSTPSSTPSDNVGKGSSDENAGYDTSFRRKELDLNNPALRVSSFSRAEGETFPKKSKKDGEFGGFYNNGSSRDGSSSRNERVRNAADFKRCSEGVLAPANWKSTNKVELQSKTSDSYVNSGRNGDSRGLGHSGAVSSGSGNRGEASSHENKLRKVKLKVGGVTRMIHAKTTSDSTNSGSSSMKPSGSMDAPRRHQKLILQDNSDDDHSPPGQGNGLQGIPWKDFSRGSLTLTSKVDSRGKISEENISLKQTDKFNNIHSSEPVRKSKRVPKRRVLDGADDDADDEIRYLERLKTSKASKSRVDDGEYDDVEYGSSRLFKEGKNKSRSERESEDTDYIEEEEEEPGLDVGPEAKRKKQRKESLDSLADSKNELSLTTRQRALKSGKDVSAGANASLIEFPNGLPPAPPRKQKEKLSEVEQQLKKAEAAQRRRMQVEKAARESEAEAIRKIRGLDSSGNKREDKLQKRRDELAQGKAATALALASSTVRWVMGPTGTIVTFPKDLGLPSLFDSKQCSYPPPREKCAGPSCTNTYKYRHSKSKLPLCSIQCYQAVHEMMQPVTTC